MIVSLIQVVGNQLEVAVKHAFTSSYNISSLELLISNSKVLLQKMRKEVDFYSQDKLEVITRN